MKHSYGIVFGLVLLSFVVQASAPDGDLARLVIIWLQAATLVAAVRIARSPHWPIRAASWLAALIAVAAPIMWIVNGSIPDGVTAIATALLVGVAPLVIAGGLVRDMRAAGAVTLEALTGVLSIYVLAGMFFSFVYAAVNTIGDESFFAEVANPNRARLPLLQLHDPDHDRLRRLHRRHRPRPDALGRRGTDRADLPGHDRGADREQPPAEAAHRRSRPGRG